MKIESIVLLACIGTLLLWIALVEKERGVAEGRLEKMEEFQETYMPNPKNIFPDAK